MNTFLKKPKSVASKNKIADIKYKRPDGNYHTNHRKKLLEKIINSEQKTSILFDEWCELRDKWSASCIIATIGFTAYYDNNYWIQESDYLNSFASEISKLDESISVSFLKRGRVGDLRKYVGKLAIDRLRVSELNNEKVALELVESRSIQEWIDFRQLFQVNLDNESRNLSEIYGILNSENRNQRKKAYKIINEYFSNEKIDNILDRLVHIRDEISKSCNYENYEDFSEDESYRDWGSDEAIIFKESVKRYIVPILYKIQKNKKKLLKIKEIENFDEGIFWKNGNPKLDIKGKEIINRCIDGVYNIFGDVGYNLVTNMDNRGLLDIYPRKNKDLSACCWLIDGMGDSYIMASLYGSEDDPETFFHEFGHALQFHLSGNNKIIELRKATRELVEIPSITSELFSYDVFDTFYGENYQKRIFVHLTYLLILVCKVCILDEWQREIYRNPYLSLSERNMKWAEAEKKWMPWRKPNPQRWKQDGTIFENPFYDLDYALAVICSLQIWLEYTDDKNIGIKKFFDLCNIGGTKNFTDAIDKINIKNPFIPNTVKTVSKKIERLLLKWYI